MTWQKLLPLLLGVWLIAGVATVAGILLAEEKGAEVAFEAAKAGLQLGLITVLGAVVALGIKQFESDREQQQNALVAARKEQQTQLEADRADHQKQLEVARADHQKQLDVAREERQRLHEYRLRLFRDTVDAYNDVKTVRRTIRALGLSAPGSGPLSVRQIDEFDAQMRALNDAELRLERIRREVEAESDAFPNASTHTGDLETSEKYLRDVLTVWEKRVVITAGDQASPRGDAAANLWEFVAKRGETPDNSFWECFRRFEDAIRVDLIDRAVVTST